MKKLVFLFFISSQIYSQKVQFKGKLLDENTNEPIAYANISFLKTNLGISSQVNGVFNLEIDKKLLQETVHISCLNYKDTILFAENVQQKTLFLQPKSFELEEIIISKKVDRELVIDTYKRKELNSGYGALKKSPWIVTKFFNYNIEYEKTPYLKNVTFHIGEFPKAKSGKFRVRFFSVDSLKKKPKDDIIQNQIIVNVKKRDKRVKVDLVKYDIEFPKEGFFIGFEFLYIPENFYEVEVMIDKDTKTKKIETFISPSLRGKVEKNKIEWVFYQGKWEQSNFNHKINESITPAISLTLSN